jgi:hypothetical protein
MVAQGELEKDPETGNFSMHQVEEILEEQAGETIDSRDEIIRALTDSFRQATDHNERLLKLLEGPISTALGTVQKINENLLKRIEGQDGAQIDMMKTVGDFLMQKDERAALQKEAEMKAQNMHDVMKLLEKATPLLIAQMAGTKPLKTFFDTLTPDERTGIADLANFLDGDEKRKQFEALLDSVGVKVPKKAEELVPDVAPLINHNPITSQPTHNQGIIP